MSFIINTNFEVRFPIPIDGRLIVESVDGLTPSLVSLQVPYNYENMYVWVKEEKQFYYLIDNPPQGGATKSDWASFSGGVSNNQGLGDGKTGSTPFYYNNDWVVQSTHLYNDGNQISINGGGLGANGTPSSYLPNDAKFTVWSDSCIAVFEAATNSFVTNIEARNWKSGTKAAAAVGIYATMGPGLDGLTLGALSKEFTDFPGYGRSCDTFIYSGACARSLNIIQQGNIGTFQDADIKLFANSDANSIPTLRVFNGGITAGAILPNSYELRFGDKDTCTDQKNGSTDATSGRYVILKSPQTLEERWTLTWPKQGPASYSTTFNTALMWNGSEYIWGTAGQLGVAGGGGGAISLKPNAGLTNSGETYATIYNTTVNETTEVEGTNTPLTTQHPLTWLSGLTAGYFRQKNIVEVLDMILFPAIPFPYTSPSLSIVVSSPTLTLYRQVNISSYTHDITLNYSPSNSPATASQYSFFCSKITNTSGIPNYVLIGSAVNSTSNTQAKSTVSFPAQIPTWYSLFGTVSHISSTICLDSAGNPTPLPAANQAGIKSTTNPSSCNFCFIFPYFYGTVSSVETTVTNLQIQSSNDETALSQNNLTVDFNTQNSSTKGFLAIPNSIGSQISVTYVKHEATNNSLNQGTIPGSLFPAPFEVGDVSVNGILHTYSVYLFSKGSATDAPFKFTT